MKTMQRVAGGFLALVLLVVFAGCAGTEGRRSTGTYVDDKTISTKIKTEMARDPVAQATQIQVETYKGVVQLSGFAATEAGKQRAEEIAKQTEGVESVRNNIVVRGDQQR